MPTIYEYPDAESVVICGDIHGKFDELVYRMTVQYGMTDTVVIVAGDCGFGFHWYGYTDHGYYDEVLRRVLPRLETTRCQVVFVRGNHDDPAYFNGAMVSHERWRCVSDYSVVCACGHHILCVGGAVSIDRGNRTAGLDYWPTEQPRLDTDALLAIRREGLAIDTVVTHTAPSMCENVAPPAWLEDLTATDPALPDDMRRERETMDALLGLLRQHGHPLRRWYYGHYHHSWQADIDGIRYTMLKELEMKELR